MDIRASLKGQYLAGFKMLGECIELCPDSIWTSGKHPRNFWRIAYHAIYYSHLYLQPDLESFVAWSKHIDDVSCLWESPDVVEPYSKQDLLDYLDDVSAKVSDYVDALDLDSLSTGFSWYTTMGKLDHQLMNLRHLQGHVGQLSELLMANHVDVEIDWVGVSGH
jgi:hypothetical protein